MSSGSNRLSEHFPTKDLRNVRGGIQDQHFLIEAAPIAAGILDVGAEAGEGVGLKARHVALKGLVAQTLERHHHSGRQGVRRYVRADHREYLSGAQ